MNNSKELLHYPLLDYSWQKKQQEKKLSQSYDVVYEDYLHGSCKNISMHRSQIENVYMQERCLNHKLHSKRYQSPSYFVKAKQKNKSCDSALVLSLASNVYSYEIQPKSQSPSLIRHFVYSGEPRVVWPHSQSYYYQPQSPSLHSIPFQCQPTQTPTQALKQTTPLPSFTPQQPSALPTQSISHMMQPLIHAPKTIYSDPDLISRLPHLHSKHIKFPINDLLREKKQYIRFNHQNVQKPTFVYTSNVISDTNTKKSPVIKHQYHFNNNLPSIYTVNQQTLQIQSPLQFQFASTMRQKNI